MAAARAPRGAVKSDNVSDLAADVTTPDAAVVSDLAAADWLADPAAPPKSDNVSDLAAATPATIVEYSVDEDGTRRGTSIAGLIAAALDESLGIRPPPGSRVCRSPVLHNGRPYVAGEPISLTPEQAAALDALSALEPIDPEV